MSTEETPVQKEIDRAWTVPLPREPTTRLNNGSQHLQELRPQLWKMRRAIPLNAITTVLWVAFGAAIYLLFTA